MYSFLDILSRADSVLIQVAKSILSQIVPSLCAHLDPLEGFLFVDLKPNTVSITATKRKLKS
jgi:hypothetical protein